MGSKVYLITSTSVYFTLYVFYISTIFLCFTSPFQVTESTPYCSLHTYILLEYRHLSVVSIYQLGVSYEHLSIFLIYYTYSYNHCKYFLSNSIYDRLCAPITPNVNQLIRTDSYTTTSQTTKSSS